MSRVARLVAEPLTPRAYALYGQVLAAAPAGEPGRPVNQGTGLRFDWLVRMENQRGAQAPLNVCVFRCQPRELPLPVRLLERHRRSTQLFIPMNAARYLVVVAAGGDRPDLGALRAFVAGGAQGISYHPGTWHHPLIALDTETDFTCLVHEDGGPDDCDEHPLGELGADLPLVVLAAP